MYPITFQINIVVINDIYMLYNSLYEESISYKISKIYLGSI